MKFQSIASFFTLYLVSGLSAKIHNSQAYQDIEYSNLQPGKKPAMGAAIGGTAGGKMKQNAAIKQQKPQQNEKKNTPAGNQHIKTISKLGNPTETRSQVIGAYRNLKAVQPTIINKSQPTQVNKPAVIRTAPGTPMHRPAMVAKGGQNLNAKATQPVKNIKPNTNPKKTTNGHKNQSNQAAVVKTK